MIAQRPTSRGFSLVEAILSVAFIAFVLSAAMQVLRQSNLWQYKAAERARGAALADGLMSEIMQQAYEDPGGTVLFGHEVGESSTSRASCNDVDDYDGWTESPPQNQDGTAMSNLSGWTRSVAVVWVNVSAPTTTSLIETGAKRITVTVKHNSVPVAVRTAVRTKAS